MDQIFARVIARRGKTLAAYSAVIVMVVAVLFLKITLSEIFGGTPVYLLFNLVVVISALLGGTGCGVFALFMLTICDAIFVINPLYFPQVADRGNAIYLFIFAVEACGLVVVIHASRRRERALIASKEALISQLRQKSEELIYRNNLFQYFMDFTPITIALFDRNMCYLAASRSWIVEHRLVDKDLRGQTIYDFFNVMPEQWRDVHRRCLAGASEGCPKDRFMFEDGTFMWTHWEVRPWRDSTGEIGGIVIWSEVINDRVKAEDALVEKQQELLAAKDVAESASKAKTAFLANMSHEIRTPLASVLGFSELLANPAISSEERSQFVTTIKRNGELLANIIADVLEISKVEAGKIDIEKRMFPLADIIPDLTSTLSLRAQEKGLQLNVSFRSPLPAMVETDPLRLRQILINIVGNAIKFTSKGSVDVRVMTLKETHMLAFVISDTGPGIDHDAAKNLFEPFSQGDPSIKRQFGGTGLGLALSRSLAKLLGGDVVLSASVPGVGSTFTVTIDPGNVEFVSVATAKSPVERGPGVKPAWVDAGTKALDGVTVLLVEDTADVQFLLSIYLRGVGATVDAVNNGREALAKVAARDYDIVLMDLQMPIMDGYEATLELRKSGFNRPIFALTAHASQDERDRCLPGGFTDHLTKPVNREALITSILTHVKPEAL